MIDWLTVLSLLVFGLALLVAEIIFVPGTTLVGILGFLFLIGGVGIAFRFFGDQVGWIVVGGTAVAAGIAIYFSFTSKLWKKFSLNTSNKSKVNEGKLDHLKVGTEGQTLSALRPVGKAELNNQTFEVKTLGEYVESGRPIRVTKILFNQIIVEPIN